MAKRIETIGNPRMLVWARETMGMDLAHAAQKAHVPQERLKSWESGSSRPSLPELARLSGLYHRPLAVFFLPEPPQDRCPPRDFRHLPGGRTRSISPDLRLAIRRAELRQDLAAELLEKEPGKIRDLLGSVSTADSPTGVASNARALVGIDVSTQMSWKDASYALNSWIFAMESVGVLVFQALGVDVNEMRGLSLHDPVAPVILLNTADAVTARVFSLFHELGHLLLGAAGLCNLDTTARTSCAEEIFCNAFAGEFLVPADALLQHDLVASKPARCSGWEGRDLDRVAADFGVSVEVALRRLVAVGKASQAFYDQP
jgi:Zn-dependent peptidase ImmA (M78 family)/transcriptional regulator with XRE-family HTH domain